MNKYIGHESQILGVEELRIVGGKGDGMRILQVRNGKGLEFTISLDRSADISRLSFNSFNVGYFAPCGYVSPKYYDGIDKGFTKSFTAGFFTTCGLTNVGTPCIDNGENLPLHGTISNTPAESFLYEINEGEIRIKAVVRQASLLSDHLLLTREYICSTEKNLLRITDKVKNIGPRTAPFMIMYHFNMGYPMLNESAEVVIPSTSVVPRDEQSLKAINDCLKVESPKAYFEAQCYFHKIKSSNNQATVGIYNHDINKGLVMKYDIRQLDCFTEWKMLGEKEYVLGIEPGNCTPVGRNIARENGQLKFIEPGEERINSIDLIFVGNKSNFDKEIKKY